jgi:hypothetical protein
MDIPEFTARGQTLRTASGVREVVEIDGGERRVSSFSASSSSSRAASHSSRVPVL